ncbi:MAG: hypothetical protein FWC53_01845 [Firmicutes bacterium]|nr:hypothetical protein [Bacillota bacterium]
MSDTNFVQQVEGNEAEAAAKARAKYLQGIVKQCAEIAQRLVDSGECEKTPATYMFHALFRDRTGNEVVLEKHPDGSPKLVQFHLSNKEALGVNSVEHYDVVKHIDERGRTIIVCIVEKIKNGQTVQREIELEDPSNWRFREEYHEFPTRGYFNSYNGYVHNDPNPPRHSQREQEVRTRARIIPEAIQTRDTALSAMEEFIKAHPREQATPIRAN